MNITRILNDSIGAWLHYEFCCDRSGLFNEKYLSVPIGQVLSSRFGDRVHAEFTHPVLAPLMKGPGRRPQIDFAYCEKWPIPTIAVETKWMGKTKLKVQDIIWDLVRLEMLANSTGAECIFVLAGKKSDLNELFRSTDFTGGIGIQSRRPILSTKSNARYKLWLLPREHYRIKLLKNMLSDYQKVPIPHCLWTVRTAPYPPKPTSSSYQVFSWKVLSSSSRETFIPENSKHYRKGAEF